MAEEVKLLGTWASPFSRRIELALRLKGVEFEYIEEDLSNKSPLLLQTNPVHKKIPVLIHNGKPIAESIVILEYIDEAWPNNPLLPKDPYDRAVARFWAKFVDDTILQTAYKSSMLTGKELEDTLEEVCHQLELLEKELKDKKFYGGEAIGFLDIIAFYIVYWFQIRQEVTGRVFFKEERFPILHKWIERICEIDVVKESLPPKDKHIAFVKERFAAMKSASK